MTEFWATEYTKLAASLNWRKPVSYGLLGAGAGALTGALVDHDNRLRGAGIGALAGGAIGAGVGASDMVEHGEPTRSWMQANDNKGPDYHGLAGDRIHPDVVERTAAGGAIINDYTRIGRMMPMRNDTQTGPVEQHGSMYSFMSYGDNPDVAGRAAPVVISGTLRHDGSHADAALRELASIERSTGQPMTKARQDVETHLRNLKPKGVWF